MLLAPDAAGVPSLCLELWRLTDFTQSKGEYLRASVYAS